MLNHHSEQEFQQSELFKMLQEQKEGTQTRKWPEGRIDGSDDGQIAFQVSTVDGKVKIDFGKPVVWAAMSPEQAVQMAQTLIKQARSVATGPLKITLH